MTDLKHVFCVFAIFASLLIFTSCNNDDDDDQMEMVEECSVSEATGTIEGRDFNFQAGRVDESGGEIDISLYTEASTIDDVCAFFGDDNVRVFGSLPNLDIGRTDFFLEPDLSDGFTITLFDPATTTNVIITGGFIEITEVTDSEVIGFLDASDEFTSDSICGTFVLTRC